MNKTTEFKDDDCKDPKKVAKWLQEYNLWRKGEGEYKWSEDPMKNRETPLTAQELSMVINAAIGYLEK